MTKNLFTSCHTMSAEDGTFIPRLLICSFGPKSTPGTNGSVTTTAPSMYGCTLQPKAYRPGLDNCTVRVPFQAPAGSNGIPGAPAGHTNAEAVCAWSVIGIPTSKFTVTGNVLG